MPMLSSVRSLCSFYAVGANGHLDFSLSRLMDRGVPANGSCKICSGQRVPRLAKKIATSKR